MIWVSSALAEYFYNQPLTKVLFLCKVNVFIYCCLALVDFSLREEEKIVYKEYTVFRYDTYLGKIGLIYVSMWLFFTQMQFNW